MEYIQYIKITVEIETNKRTIEKTFESFKAFDHWRTDYLYDNEDPVACVIAAPTE